MSDVQDWEGSTSVGDLAAQRLRALLEATPKTGLWFKTEFVDDVQNDQRYQKLGIDFLWMIQTYSGICAITPGPALAKGILEGTLYQEH